MPMTGIKSIFAAILLTPFPSICLAGETLPIDNSYGNKDGCAYAKSAESTGSENFFLLTKEAVTTASSYCTFKKIGPIAGKGYPVTLTCEEEGGENPADFEVIIAPAGKDAMEVRFEDGTLWGPLQECR